jgi:hypothetical protein
LAILAAALSFSNEGSTNRFSSAHSVRKPAVLLNSGILGKNPGELRRDYN